MQRLSPPRDTRRADPPKPNVATEKINNVHPDVNSGSTLPTGNVIIRGDSGDKEVRLIALLDSGATASIISRRAARKIGLKGDYSKVSLQTPSSTLNLALMKTKIIINNVEKDHKEEIYAYVLPQFPDCAEVIDWSLYPELWDHLKIEDKPKFAKLASQLGDKVDLILGNNAIKSTAIQRSTLFSDKHNLIGEKTVLGWAVRGPLPANLSQSGKLWKESINSIFQNDIVDEFVDTPSPEYTDISGEPEITKLNLITDSHHNFLTELSSIGIDPELTKETNGVYPFELQYLVKKFCQSLDLPQESPDERLDNAKTTEQKAFLDSKFQLKGDKVFAGILWKDGAPPVNMPANKNQVFKMSKAAFERLSSEYKVHVVNNFQEALDLGFGEIIDASELKDGEYNFIPWLCVNKEDSTTTPVRVVLNCSQKFGSGEERFSLAVTAFRDGPIGFLLDIQKMFMKVYLNEEDKNYCLVWVFLDKRVENNAI